MRLRRGPLGTLPHPSSRGRDILPLRHRIPALPHLPQHALHKRTLANPRAQEDRVDDDENPASLLEHEGGAEETEPQRDLEAGDDGHAGVVVVFDEAADALAQSAGFGFLALGRRGRWLDGREQDAARVGCYVEDAVDGEGEEGEGGLAREEPD